MDVFVFIVYGDLCVLPVSRPVSRVRNLINTSTCSLGSFHTLSCCLLTWTHSDMLHTCYQEAAGEDPEHVQRHWLRHLFSQTEPVRNMWGTCQWFSSCVKTSVFSLVHLNHNERKAHVTNTSSVKILWSLACSTLRLLNLSSCERSSVCFHAEVPDHSLRVSYMKDLVQSLPLPNHDTMELLFKHLHKWV